MFEIKFIRQIFYWIDTSVRKRKSRLKAIFALKSFFFLQGLSIILKKKKKKVLGKKVCAFEFCLVLFKKYTIREKSRVVQAIFSHQQSSIYFVLRLDSVQIHRFFSYSATLHTQKKVKEIAYILTCYQTL